MKIYCPYFKDYNHFVATAEHKLFRRMGSKDYNHFVATAEHQLFRRMGSLYAISSRIDETAYIPCLPLIHQYSLDAGFNPYILDSL